MLVEGDGTGVCSVFVDEVGSEEGCKGAGSVRSWDSVAQLFQSNLLDQCSWEDLSHDGCSDARLIEQVCGLQLLTENIECLRQLRRDDRAWLACTLMLGPNGFKLLCCIGADDVLDVGNVGQIERRWLAIFECHILCVLFVLQAETAEHLETTARHTTLVGTRIGEENDALSLELNSCLLGDEQIGALDNVLEVRFAFCVRQRSNVGYVDSLRAPTTRHEQVRLEPEMCPISEICAIQNNLAGYY